MNVIYVLRFVVICCLSCLFNVFGKDVTQKNFELLQQFETFLKTKGKNKSEMPSHKTVKDKNFEIIEKSIDNIKKIFESNPDILSKRPSDYRLAMDCISKSIYERQNMFQDKEIIEGAKTAVLETCNQYEEIIPHIQNLIILLRCVDTISSNTIRIVKELTQKDSTKPITQSDAEELFNKLAPMVRYLPENTQNMLKMIFIEASKTKFEERPNIPSYYMFHLMKNILDNIEKIFKNLNQTTFLRSFENATYTMQKLLTDLDLSAKSDQTAKNVASFFESAKKTVMSQMDFIQKREKEWKEYISAVTMLLEQVKKALNEAVETKKDQTIFDNVTEQQPA